MKLLIFVVVSLVSTSCVTNSLTVTSEPDGAVVLFYHSQTDEWVEKGVAPCSVNLNYKYDPSVVRIVFPSGKIIHEDLNAGLSPIRNNTGHFLGLGGFTIAFSGMLGNAPYALYTGVGISVFGSQFSNYPYVFKNTSIHILEDQNGETMAKEGNYNIRLGGASI